MAQSTTVRTTTIPKIHNRSSPTNAPKIETDVVGSDEFTIRGDWPNIKVTNSWRITRSARVATTLVRTAESFMRRMKKRWKAAPTAAELSTPMVAERSVLTPHTSSTPQE